MVEIRMPQLGESIHEGTVVQWLKQVGDVIAQDEPIVEIVTDKIDSEVPAPAAGVLSEILVAEGATVVVGTILARMVPASATESEASAPPPAGVAAPALPAKSVSQVNPPVSPVVARIAAEYQIDLSQIRGSGAGGRVSKKDVLRFLATREATTPAAPAGRPPAPLPPTEPTDVAILPLSPMRRAIADHMSRSVREAPQVTTIFEIDFGRVTTHLQQQKASYQQQGVHLTYTAYLVAATAKALREVPVLNGRYTEQGIILNRQVNIGVAVALDDGLIVPVIRDADERSLLGIARSLADLSERARQSRLTAEDVQGGTFTISNHGVGGSLLATPIINQPQSGILGAGAITRRAMVIERDGEEAIAIRPVGYLALTFDHRVCDGAVADRFMRVIKTAIEQFG